MSLLTSIKKTVNNNIANVTISTLFLNLGKYKIEKRFSTVTAITVLRTAK
jgi:hypothetical protein